jgi:hypothetical protein
VPKEQTAAPSGRPENTWIPIVLALGVLVFSTIVVVAASLYFRDDPPAGATPAPSASTSASATPSTGSAR